MIDPARAGCKCAVVALLLVRCGAVVSALAKLLCSCLVFGEPMITPKMPLPVNVGCLYALSATPVTVPRETVDNRPLAAQRHVQSGGSHKNFSTT